MAGFTKLFNSILDSTIWQEPNETRILWITMLAMCDARGEVQASIPGLARRAGISIPECESGLVTLSSPDAYSRTKDHEGRRIQEIDGGWRLLNHGRYRELLSAEERKAYNTKKQAEWRAKKAFEAANGGANSVNDMSMTVNDNKHRQHISEADSRLQKQREREEHPPALPEVVPTGRRFPDHAAIIARINAVRPEWKKPAQWMASELHALHDALSAFEEMEDEDWKMIERYMASKLPEGAGYWQPRNRSQFVSQFADVFGHVQRWAGKTGNTAPKPKLGGAWK